MQLFFARLTVFVVFLTKYIVIILYIIIIIYNIIKFISSLFIPLILKLHNCITAYSALLNNYRCNDNSTFTDSLREADSC